MVEAPQQSAEVAELADASVSKTDVRKDVRVRLPISAPHPTRGELCWSVGTIPGPALNIKCGDGQGTAALPGLELPLAPPHGAHNAEYEEHGCECEEDPFRPAWIRRWDVGSAAVLGEQLRVR